MTAPHLVHVHRCCSSKLTGFCSTCNVLAMCNHAYTICYVLAAMFMLPASQVYISSVNVDIAGTRRMSALTCDHMADTLEDVTTAVAQLGISISNNGNDGTDKVRWLHRANCAPHATPLQFEWPCRDCWSMKVLFKMLAFTLYQPSPVG